MSDNKDRNNKNVYTNYGPVCSLTIGHSVLYLKCVSQSLIIKNYHTTFSAQSKLEYRVLKKFRSFAC